MSKRVAKIVKVIGSLALVIPFVVGIGCSQQEQPSAPPQQTTPTAPVQPAPAPPVTTAPQPGMPAPQPMAPQTQAPMMTAQNFSQVQLGMSSEQVRQLLGNPTAVEPEGSYVEWKYLTPQGRYQVKFQNDRVVGFKMY
jgi:hypothetical protein